MWAQLISARLKPGKDDGLALMMEQVNAAEPPGSGLVRRLVMRDQADPGRAHILVVFESEAKARERESDAAHREALEPARATMADIFDGPPEFTDFDVVADWAP